MSWRVLLHPDAEVELSKIPARERVAVATALDKLRAIGPVLGFPHTSAVRGSSDGLRELRPRQGRSPWRAFYRQIGDALVVGAIGPEAEVDPRGFTRSVRSAERRLEEVEEEG
ncbi:MAG: type II toxin-antitoxin system RelE/ParE family toxin [Nocardioides sp.]